MISSATTQPEQDSENTAGERWHISVGDTFRTRDKGWLTILHDRGNGYFMARHSDPQPVNQEWSDVRFDGHECYHAYFGRRRWWDLMERVHD